MVELGVLLCSSFNEKNEPVDGASVMVAGANCVSDIRVVLKILPRRRRRPLTSGKSHVSVV